MHGPSLTKEKSFQMPPASPSHRDGRHTGPLTAPPPPSQGSGPVNAKEPRDKRLLISSENTSNFSSWSTGLLASAFAFLDFQNERFCVGELSDQSSQPQPGDDVAVLFVPSPKKIPY